MKRGGTENTGLESIKKSSTLESSTLAISTLYLEGEGEGRDHTCDCAVSDVLSRVELSSFKDSTSSPGDSTIRGGGGPARAYLPVLQ